MNGTWLALGAAGLALGISKSSRGSRASFTRDGFPWPQDQPLYHGSTALGAIKKEGFRTRQEGASESGGGRHDLSVSFTLSPKRASAFALAFDVLRRGAVGEVRLVQLLDRLREEIPNAFPEAIVSGYNLQGITMGQPAPFNRLRGYLRKIDAGWKCVTTFDEVPIRTGVQQVSGSIYLVPPSMNLEDAFYPRSPSQKREAWTRGRLTYFSRGEIFFETYRSGLNWGSNAEECFNPYLVSTDMKALGERRASDMGVVVATSSVPRICANRRGALALGYFSHASTELVLEMDSWYLDCEEGLELQARNGTSKYAKSRSERPLTSTSYFRPERSRIGDWDLEDSGSRHPKSAMLYYDGEQEVRIYDTTRIEVRSVWTMDDIRRKFDLGDRLTFPWFNPATEDNSVWPPAQLRLRF